MTYYFFNFKTKEVGKTTDLHSFAIDNDFENQENNKYEEYVFSYDKIKYLEKMCICGYFCIDSNKVRLLKAVKILMEKEKTEEIKKVKIMLENL